MNNNKWTLPHRAVSLKVGGDLKLRRAESLSRQIHYPPFVFHPGQLSVLMWHQGVNDRVLNSWNSPCRLHWVQPASNYQTNSSLVSDLQCGCELILTHPHLIVPDWAVCLDFSQLVKNFSAGFFAAPTNYCEVNAWCNRSTTRLLNRIRQNLTHPRSCCYQSRWRFK